MVRNMHRVVICLALVIAAGLSAAALAGWEAGPALAQEGPDAWTDYPLNLRAGPGAQYAVITVLDSGVGMIFEGRSADLVWMLGHTEDGAFRGWVASLYLSYQVGYAAANLPITDEVIPVAAAPAGQPLTAGDGAGGTVAAGINPALESMPTVPAISSHTRTIFERGQALGNQANVVTKVGECNSMSYAFLVPFGNGNYDLGPYSGLQAVVNYFSFAHGRYATGAGFTAATVVDPAWGDPARCPGLSPLECEYMLTQPSVAFIMLGMHDVHFLDGQQYEQSMRRVIEISLDKGVIPVLTTFPIWPGDDVRTARRFEFNTILVNLAREYDVPLMNFWLAANGVDHSGVGVDHVHITERGDNWTSFNGEQNQWGMTMWNLVALQTLEQLRGGAIN